MPGGGPVAELVLGEQLEHEVEHRLAGVERLHVDVDVRAELAGRGAAAAAAARRRRRAPSSGASGRSSGVSAETLTETLARGSGPMLSRSSIGRAGQRAAAGASCSSASAQRAGVAVGLGLR